MAIQKNNSDYGFSLQKLICDKYDLEVWGSAIGDDSAVSVPSVAV